MKVTIAGGAGGVGASVAYNLLVMGVDHDVVLVDRRPEMITSHVMDLEQVLTLGGGRSIRGGDASDYADADVLVVTAGAPLIVNTSRNVFLEDNAMIVDEVVDSLPSDWDGILLIVTNPVDPLVTRAWRRADIHRGRLLGYTLNDSLRLRTVIAKAAHVPPDVVEAWTIGEHGDLCVSVWDQVTVDGVPVDLDASVRADAEEGLRTWYLRHVALDSGRTSTWTSGLGVARMVAAMASDAGELWPASIVLDGEYGIADVALSVPVILGRRGVERIVRWTLTATQEEVLGRAAQAVGELVRRVTLHADRRTQAVIPEP